MAIQAVRYTLPDSDESFDAALRSVLVTLLTSMLKDEELENRRLALTTFNSAAHNKPDLIIPNLQSLLPLVIQESVVKPDHIRGVMMGPFEHKVDDGLELRKVGLTNLTT
jgi:cullin-associated NEDD8-dissociated protein 1